MISKSAEHEYDERPWGSYEVLLDETGTGFKVKRIEVKPKSRLSLQKHARRGEIWIVVKGEGIVTVGEEEVPVKTGSVVNLPKEAQHRMTNNGDEPLIFVEVQLGDYLGEDDITRLQDDYNRT
ncbi:MAG: phosphomannose isomerase type II C-terminal cupin domain [Candidatus Omnitrophota bacterium]|nr:phosphomannose isomerase type II C-terminal cupin domain [Candidatus Omnitrophota bacterium]